MADLIKIFQNLAQVEYQVPSKIKATQIIAQVEYVPTPPGQFTTTCEVTVTLDPSAETHPEWQTEAAVTVEIDPTPESYYYQGPGEFVTEAAVTVTLTPEATTIWDRVCIAAVMVEILPEAETYCPVRFALCEATIEIIPEAATRMPVPGWDPETGFGIIDLTFLDGNPPFWAVLGDITLSLDPTAESFGIYAEESFESVGRLKFGGRATVEYFSPTEMEVTAEGGVAVGGESEIEFSEVSIYEHTTSGGLIFGGASKVEHYVPSPLVYEVEVRGGVKISGTSSPEFTSPADLIYEHTAEGGVKVGPVRVPEVEWIYPGFDLDVYEVTTAVELMVGGEAEIEFPEEPPVYEHETKWGGIKVGGACAVAWFFPEIYEWETRGGVVLSGSGLEEEAAFYTFALAGYTFEPSLYSGFPFNSYAAQNGRVLAAAADGIYVLEGEDDDGAPIHPGVAIGPTSLGIDNYKRLRHLHLGDCGEAQVKVSGKTRGREGYYSKNRDKYTVGRDLEDKIHTIEIEDFTSLSQMEIDLIVMEGR
ncbi:MAG: hypothetical protein AB1491_00060 [Thermodesulfobacteriota bacterium]